MKNTGLILKKAELFERLSLYGNRNDFLATFAQQVVFPDESISNSLNTIHNKCREVISKLPAEASSNLKMLLNSFTPYVVTNLVKDEAAFKQKANETLSIVKQIKSEVQR